MSEQATEKTDEKLAPDIAKVLRVKPDSTVQEIAAKVEASEEQVIRVLDCYHPTDGHVGEGQGNGWITDEQRAELVVEHG
jgi:putative heme iron utilization protein